MNYKKFMKEWRSALDTAIGKKLKGDNTQSWQTIARIFGVSRVAIYNRRMIKGDKYFIDLVS